MPSFLIYLLQQRLHVLVLSFFGIIIATVLLIITIDPLVALYFHRYPVAEGLLNAIELSSQLVNPVLISAIASLYAITYLMYRKYNSTTANLTRCYYFSLSLILSFIMVAILKVLIGRHRPDLLMETETYGFTLFSLSSENHSFPSGHAAITSTLLFAWKFFFNNRVILLLIALLLLVILPGRILTGAHYPSDVIFGVFIAYFSVFMINTFYRFNIVNHNQEKSSNAD